MVILWQPNLRSLAYTTHIDHLPIRPYIELSYMFSTALWPRNIVFSYPTIQWIYIEKKKQVELSLCIYHNKNVVLKLASGQRRTTTRFSYAFSTWKTTENCVYLVATAEFSPYSAVYSFYCVSTQDHEQEREIEKRMRRKQNRSWYFLVTWIGIRRKKTMISFNRAYELLREN